MRNMTSITREHKQLIPQLHGKSYFSVYGTNVYAFIVFLVFLLGVNQVHKIILPH